jgi:hypothetical protein
MPRAALLAATLAAAPANAVEEVTLAVGGVDGGDWSAGDIVLALAFPGGDRVSARLTTRDLVLPEPLHALDSASVDCPLAEVSASSIDCARAELRLRGGDGGPLVLPLSMGLARRDDGWWLRLETKDVDPGSLWGFAADQGPLPALEIGDGTLSLSLTLRMGTGDATARASLSDLTFSDPPGLHAGEGLGARLEASLSRAGGGWRGAAELALDSGQLYLDPVFVDAGATHVSLAAEAEIDASAPSPILSRWRLHHEGVAGIAGAIALDGNRELASLDLHLSPTPADPVYRNYLQPFAVGTLFDGLRLEGDMDARVQWRPAAGGWRVRLDLDDVGLDDAAGRFHLFGVGGILDWRELGGADATRLAWAGGRVYRIDFGAGTLDGRLAGRRFDLGAPVRVPLLAGAVTVDALEVAAIGTPDVQWKFRGTVEPMSLEALTGALAWPAFGGTLGGDIPQVSYANGVVTVDGSLDMAVFDGAVSVRQLSVADPFGVVPVLRADVDFRDLSLDALTSTFSFGNIQGKLQGRVHGLVLKDWKPTAFDARFATPEDDDSRHRISQRAVENLASLGGAGAVLSTTFLRLFEEFSYRRLGISCRLHNGVCDMDGVAPATRGYYIVEGGGLPPRIDVLGFNRRVDWDVLLGRVRQIVTSDGPVVR